MPGCDTGPAKVCSKKRRTKQQVERSRARRDAVTRTITLTFLSVPAYLRKDTK